MLGALETDDGLEVSDLVIVEHKESQVAQVFEELRLLGECNNLVFA